MIIMKWKKIFFKSTVSLDFSISFDCEEKQVLR